MFNLCSQHVQSINSVQQKFFVLQPFKDMFQMRPRRCRQTWIRQAKFPLEMGLMAIVMAALRSGMVWGLCLHTLSLR